VLAEKTGRFRQVFARADDATPDCAGADEAFEVLRSLGYLTTHAENVRTRPADVGRTSPRTWPRAALLRPGCGARHGGPDRPLPPLAAVLRGLRPDPRPSITISPRPWTELYPAQIDGKPTRTYFHWLALAYAATLPGHPALSLPVGLDHSGMPFGLQIVGPRGATPWCWRRPPRWRRCWRAM